LQQIGKTSSLVLTLCGVLKDILLVAASIMIWGTPVTSTQFFGYSIALGGLVYYKLGAEQIKNHIMEVNRNWQEFGNKKPAARHCVILGLVVLTVFILLGGLAPSFAVKSGTYLRSLLGGSQVSS
jgi:arginine exporter protein ArgO